MKILLTIVVMILIVIVAGIIFIYSGIYDVSAIKPEGKLTAWVLSTVSDNSVEHYSKGIQAPPLSDTTLINAGFKNYDRMCSGCHGYPGTEPGGKGFNPQPPSLIEGVADLSDAEIFWITRNGIKMTGMPAFGKNFPDSTIWEIVSFVHLLPKMNAEEYKNFRIKLGQPREER
jgi:mono/diheme cytochrome c family protein